MHNNAWAMEGGGLLMQAVGEDRCGSCSLFAHGYAFGMHAECMIRPHASANSLCPQLIFEGIHCALPSLRESSGMSFRKLRPSSGNPSY